MKAVNLLPPDLRSASRRGRASGIPAQEAPGGSGPFVVLGALAMCVLMLAGYVLAASTVKERRAEPAEVTRQHEVAARQAAALGRETGAPIRLRAFFPGISDMSFLQGAESPAELAVMAANTPAWGSRICHDYAAIQALDLPAINVGPWGRDYHQRTERVYMPYAFGVVPELIWRIVHDLLSS